MDMIDNIFHRKVVKACLKMCLHRLGKPSICKYSYNSARGITKSGIFIIHLEMPRALYAHFAVLQASVFLSCLILIPQAFKAMVLKRCGCGIVSVELCNFALRKYAMG